MSLLTTNLNNEEVLKKGKGLIVTKSLNNEYHLYSEDDRFLIHSCVDEQEIYNYFNDYK